IDPLHGSRCCQEGGRHEALASSDCHQPPFVAPRHRKGVPVIRSRTVRLAGPRALALVAVAAMLLVSTTNSTPAVTRSQVAASAHHADVDPDLLAKSSGDVRVIVQSLDGAYVSTEHAIKQAGGVVTLDLPIINGVAATLPAKAISGLATVEGVRAISLDRPVTV